ncbi:glutamyl-tRNA reductase [Actinokineospora xionganensis]|uniref:Glutamyl-tRNA reductase n=1 Tax=Actinokineospora xionganensis TaxID=2684470 RepID=A0ABR7L1E3_9PSEU|nr:glutamyl-tRNA reductase [Actinokineospora xionganensis]MBC6446503.1 glutamyl-tRNA reductase [Actinokineospora xionganensis]
MSILAVGMSHHTADLRVLERVTVPAVDVPKVLADLLSRSNISEALLVSTCNRVEVYAVVDAFHAGLNDVVDVLARHSGDDVTALHDHLYVHYAGSAAQHLFTVAAGLDSMVVGEPQILGQVRQAYNVAREQGTVGRTLHELVQTSLRIGKRVHTDTGLDRAGGSVVSEALADAEQALGGLTGRTALIIGAGSMGGLAAAALRRAAIGEVVVANRTEANGARLAASLAEQGVPARSAGLADLPELIAAADVVVACTGAVGSVVPVSAVAPRSDRPLVICDLGLPRDVEDGVAAVAGVRLVDLDSLQRRLADAPSGLDTRRAGEIVAEEVRAYLAAQRSAEVTPTVTALRKRAAEVVDAELLRLHSRLPDLDGSTRDELARTVRRVVDKLLHTPTVRVKELASGPEGSGYAEALRELFGLDPQAPASLTATRIDSMLEPTVLDFPLDGGR